MIRALVLLSLITGCGAAKQRAVEGAMDRIWNQGDLTVIDAAYTPEIAHRVREFVLENRALYPDIRIHIDESIITGPHFVTRWTVTGTHRDLHKPVTLHGVSVRRREGGVFVEESMYYDMKSVYDQLGFRVIPPAGTSPFGATAVAAGDTVSGVVIDASGFRGDAARAVHKEALVSAPRAAVFRALATPEGWRAFFDVEARITLKVGGPYEILFDPTAPEGERGSEGCQVLAWVPDRMLTFSWSAPPSFPEERAERTWVAILLADAPGGTLVTLDHVGFGEGGRWGEIQPYFDKAWGMVLTAVQAHFPAPPPPPGPAKKKPR